MTASGVMSLIYTNYLSFQPSVKNLHVRLIIYFFNTILLYNRYKDIILKALLFFYTLSDIINIRCSCGRTRLTRRHDISIKLQTVNSLLTIMQRLQYFDVFARDLSSYNDIKLVIVI